MLKDVREYTSVPKVKILGTGRTVLPEEYRVTNRELILHHLCDTAMVELRQDLDPGRKLQYEELIEAADRKFVETTGIRSRNIFTGTTDALGALAAESCLTNAGVTASEIDVIIAPTNTGNGYPSTATEIKRLIKAPVGALCFDMQEACPVGAVGVYLGWQQVKLGAKRVLVVAAEKAINLPAPRHGYKDDNLFGCEAGAMLLGPHEDGWPNEADDFVFHSFRSDPFDGKSELIAKTPEGFQQNGPAVHRFVGADVPAQLDEDFKSLNLDPASIDHFFPHQPSGKTLDFLVQNIRRRWPNFRATVHRNIEDHGNTSAACTSWMIDRGRREGTVRTGQLCLVSSFGAGLSTASYAFCAR